MTTTAGWENIYWAEFFKCFGAFKDARKQMIRLRELVLVKRMN